MSSLRERKKERTRHALVDAAYELFSTHGYQATTLEEVAELADVHVQTLYRYFPTKESLALERIDEIHRRIRDPLMDPAREADAVTTYVTVRAENFDAWKGNRQFHELWRMVDEVPILRGSQLSSFWDDELALADAIARDRGLAPEDDVHGRLVAGLLISISIDAIERWGRARADFDIRGFFETRAAYALDRFGRPG